MRKKNSLVFDSHPLNKHFTHIIRLEEKERNSNDDKVAQEEKPSSHETTSYNFPFWTCLNNT